MFKFLKKKPEPEPRKEEEIAITDVYLWLESFELRSQKKIQGIVAEKSANISQIVEEAKERIEVLSKAKLRNDKIPEREKDFMKGSREAFIRSFSQFLGKIVISEKDYSIVGEYKALFEELTKQTTRANTVLQDYFANETRKIRKVMKKLMTELDEVNEKIKESRLDDIPIVKDELGGLFSRIQEHERTHKRLMKKQKLLSEWEDQLKSISAKKNEITESEEYSDLQYVTGLKDEVMVKIDRLEASFRESFSSINAALKKYVRVQFKDEIVSRDYLANPISAIKRDFTLKIVKILEQLKVAVENGQVELKPAKKQKVLAQIDKMGEDYFKNFLASYNDLFKRKLELEKSIEKNKTLQEIKACEDEIDKFTSDIETLKDEIHSMETQVDKLQIEEYKNKIERKLSDITDVNLTLIG